MLHLTGTKGPEVDVSLNNLSNLHVFEYVNISDWSKFVKNKLWSWEQTNLAWGKNYTGELKIIYYDDLVEDVEGTLREILSFIKFPINEVKFPLFLKCNLKI